MVWREAWKITRIWIAGGAANLDATNWSDAGKAHVIGSAPYGRTIQIIHAG